MIENKPGAVRVRILGGFSVLVGSQNLGHNEWRLKNAAALVKLPALARNHRLHREQVMDKLWPRLGKSVDPNNLCQTLHATRRVLDPSEGAAYLRGDVYAMR